METCLSASHPASSLHRTSASNLSPCFGRTDRDLPTGRTAMTIRHWTVLLAALATANAAYPRALTTYDYVVVGGGTAGLTLAARLSEDEDVTVAVVEAGAYHQMTNPVLSSTPAGAPIWSGSSPADVNPGVDWGFVTAPQAGANGREIHYARGKCLGGRYAGPKRHPVV
jgi:hypothetical protein